MIQQYYVRDNNKIYGPVSVAKIQLFVSKGFFSMSCEVSADQHSWIPAASMMPLTPPRVVQIKSGSAELSPPPEEIEQQSVSAPPPRKKGEKGSGVGIKILISILILMLLGISGVVGYFVWAYTSDKQAEAKKAAEAAKTPQTFKEATQKYGNCVGLVTVVLEKDGELLSAEVGGKKISSVIPIGTAFAISENQFVTNSHVAQGLKGQKDALILKIVIAVAKANGAKTEADLKKFIEENKKDIEDLKNGLKVRSVEVRLSHSSGKRHTVKSIQVHPDYGSKQEESRNAEFDIAILHVEEKIDNFFPLANTETLYNLAVGQEIAYLGFPMEGLADAGGIDINSPEAVFKSGSIGKITDFNNKVSGAPEDNKSITHNLAAVGGASGSPIFLKNGEVVAILWGVSHFSNNGRRQASAALHNKALRIDALEKVKTSKIYSWQEWMGE